MFEPDEVKVSRPVLRGLGAGNSPRLPGDKPQMFKVHYWTHADGLASSVSYPIKEAVLKKVLQR